MTSSCSLENGSILDGFCAVELPISISKPRSVAIEKDSGRIFVLERGIQAIVHLFDSDGDGIPDTKEFVVYANGLNHGLALWDGFVYASSDTTVYRWPLYDAATGAKLEFPLTTTNANGVVGVPLEGEIVVDNINDDGNGGAPQGHTTRTLAVDDKDTTGTMYVSVGSNANVDGDSHRSRIRRFETRPASNSNLDSNSDSNSTRTMLPLDFQSMEVFADGLRNEVGLAFDKHGILWGVENSADNLARDDLGGDIHQNNPAEELNRFRPDSTAAHTPRHYGYPYCWTEYALPENGVAPPPVKGTVWAWPSFLDSGTVTDEECRSDAFEAPVLALQGHSAPLGITFFSWEDRLSESNSESKSESETCQGVESFPKDMDGFAFIAYHGSWNRDVPTGYKVVYVPMDGNGDVMEGGGAGAGGGGGEPIDLLAHAPPNAQWEDGFRPVDVAFDECGRLLVTSDGTKGRGSKVVLIEYVGLGNGDNDGGVNGNGDGNGDGDRAAALAAAAGKSSAGVVVEARFLGPTTTLVLCLVWMLMSRH